MYCLNPVLYHLIPQHKQYIIVLIQANFNTNHINSSITNKHLQIIIKILLTKAGCIFKNLRDADGVYFLICVCICLYVSLTHPDRKKNERYLKFSTLIPLDHI